MVPVVTNLSRVKFSGSLGRRVRQGLGGAASGGARAPPLSSDYHPHTAYSRGQRKAAAQASGGSYARYGATTQVSPERALMGDGPRSGRRQQRRALSSTATAAPASKGGRVRLNINEVACAGVLVGLVLLLGGR